MRRLQPRKIKNVLHSDCTHIRGDMTFSRLSAYRTSVNPRLSPAGSISICTLSSCRLRSAGENVLSPPGPRKTGLGWRQTRSVNPADDPSIRSTVSRLSLAGNPGHVDQLTATLSIKPRRESQTDASKVGSKNKAVESETFV